MPLFEIMIPRDSRDPLDTELIGDRFSWGAALLPPLWALMHKMWLEAFGWFAGLVVIVTTGLYIGGDAAFLLYVLFAIWIGFAAADLRIASLRRKGFFAAGPRIAENMCLAERDWLEELSR